MFFSHKGYPLSITANENNKVLTTHARKKKIKGKNRPRTGGKPVDSNSASSYYYRTKTH
jgi:hypothetical protein